MYVLFPFSCLLNFIALLHVDLERFTKLYVDQRSTYETFIGLTDT